MEKPVLWEAAWRRSRAAIRPPGCGGRAAGAPCRERAESTQTDLTEAGFAWDRPLPRGSLGWGCNRPGDLCCWAEGAGDGERCKPLQFEKPVSWPFLAQRGSCLKVHVKVIWVCSGCPASGTVSVHPSECSVRLTAGCRRNRGAAAAAVGVLLPHGRPGSGRSLAGGSGVSFPSRRTCGSPEGWVLVVCWDHLKKSLEPETHL